MLKRIIGISLIALSINSVYCQGDSERIANLAKYFTELSENSFVYDLRYLEEKRTFILNVSNKDDKIIYKFLEQDINDEAIFF